MQKEEIIEILKKNVLSKVLDEDIYDFKVNDIKEDELLFGDNSLEIDSVDALECLVNIQKEFGFKVQNISPSFFTTNMLTLNHMANFISNNIVLKK